MLFSSRTIKSSKSMDNLTTGEKLESSQDSSSITDLAVNNTQEPFTTEHVPH